MGLVNESQNSLTKTSLLRIANKTRYRNTLRGCERASSMNKEKRDNW